jgi:hypothetical protein
MNSRVSFRRLWARWVNRGLARVVMIDENGHRMEYVHQGRGDDTGWTFMSDGKVSGYIAVAEHVETFLRSRGHDD